MLILQPFIGQSAFNAVRVQPHPLYPEYEYECCLCVQMPVMI